jgi:Protein of unknown function (DUF938)
MPEAETVADLPISSYVTNAAKRNRDPILDVFKQLFPASGDALELASGSGTHINYFAPHFPHIRFQPSDYNEAMFDVIRGMQTEYANANVWDPIHIDLGKPHTWPEAEAHRYDVIFAINVLHVAPPAVADGVMQIAAGSYRMPDCWRFTGRSSLTENSRRRPTKPLTKSCAPRMLWNGGYATSGMSRKPRTITALS